MNELNFSCTPEEAKDAAYLENRIRQELGISKTQKLSFRWRKRSIDARQKQIKIKYSTVRTGQVMPTLPTYHCRSLEHRMPFERPASTPQTQQPWL